MRTRWIICGIAVIALGGCTLLSPVDITGSWAGELIWGPDDPMAGFSSSLGLVIEQSGVDISGVVTLEGPGATSIVIPITTGRARLSGFEIRCSETVEVAGTPYLIDLSLDGERDGNRLSGTGEQTVEGETSTFEWAALYAGPAAP
jgi:hypothetical protein